MTKFRYNNLIYELPPGFDIEITVGDEHVDFNFVRDGEWGEHLPMFGGVGEDGEKLPTWKDLGIKLVKNA